MSKGDDLYAASGVNLNTARDVPDWIENQSFLQSIALGKNISLKNGFAGLFDFDFSTYQDPVLVSSTDGVGSKILLAVESGQASDFKNLAFDLVGMCVNDLYCLGARPLFFLDYFASGMIEPDLFRAFISGLKDALQQSQCVLLGGETAEMPGLYARGHFDCAGFVIGVAERSKLPQTAKVNAGDQIVALASSGFHSSGFSLIRKWLKDYPVLNQPKIVSRLLTPTRIYNCIPSAMEVFPSIKGVAHITGGGLPDNLERCLPDNLRAEVHYASLRLEEWVKEIFNIAEVSPRDLATVFNLGCGMTIVISPNDVDKLMDFFRSEGIDAWCIGEVKPREADEEKVILL